MKASKALSQSITARLSQLARKQQKPYDKILTLFLLERVVARLTEDSNLAQHLVFKGGYVSVRVYGSPRFTMDVDAVLKGISQEETTQRIKAQLSVEKPDGTWFRFENEERLATQSEYGGLRLSYRGGLGEPPRDIKRAQIIQVDLGTGDPVTPAPKHMQTESILGEDTLSWQVYPVETILAEKIHSLLTKGAANSRARDVYDVHLLLPKASTELLKSALRATFKYRGDTLPSDIAKELQDLDTSILERGWQSATGYIEGVGDFNTVFDEIIQTFTGDYYP